MAEGGGGGGRPSLLGPLPDSWVRAGRACLTRPAGPSPRLWGEGRPGFRGPPTDARVGVG